MLAWLMRDFRTILISNMIFGKLHGAILKLCRAFCEHAHAAGALYQISSVVSFLLRLTCHYDISAFLYF
jgi:hypothetical protein